VPGAVKDIILEQKYFNTIFFSCIHSFLTLPQMNWRKKLKFAPPYFGTIGTFGKNIFSRIPSEFRSTAKLITEFDS
jgi:hypothetical protein